MNAKIEYTKWMKIGNCSFINEETAYVGINGKTKRRAKFKCICGTLFIAIIDNVRRNKTTSCGCIQKMKAVDASKTHGMSNSSEFDIWNTMIQRCHNENNQSYSEYGARGIVVCDKWRNSFVSFYNDMGKRPSTKHSIDRIDNNKGYYKENCKWSTHKEQCNNRRNSILIEYNGAIKTLAEWSDIFGLKYNMLRDRIKKHNWSIHEAFTIPVKRENRYIHRV